MRRWLLAGVMVLTGGSLAGVASAAAPVPEFKLLIKDQQFQPATLTVPAGVVVMLWVTNHDAQPAEFESTDLNREKIVLAGSTITVRVGPLKPGRYQFFDDFHQATTGQLIVE